jgi:hypothetical protein
MPPQEKLKPGQGPSPAEDSMANAIERAFLDEWGNFMGERPEPSGDQLKAMRHIFVAVARGVVKHLAENPEAFRVSITDDEAGTGHVQNIRTTPEDL